MKELVLPVPETVSATYPVPVPSPVSTAEARRLASEAVEARLTGPLRTLTAEWLASGRFMRCLTLEQFQVRPSVSPSRNEVVCFRRLVARLSHIT